MTRYRTIVADPPWRYPSPGSFVDGPSPIGCGSGSAVRYGSMTMADLSALDVPAEDDAHLYLWTTNAFIVEAHDLARSWGFEPKQFLTWMKTIQGDPTRVSMRTGYYFRGATEHFLFCVRGSLPLQTGDALPTGFLWPRLPHSVKPDAFYDLVEQASPGPFLEMFSRRARFGWSDWGDEALAPVSLAGEA